MPIAVSDAVERLVKNRATLQIMSPLSESASDLSIETAIEDCARINGKDNPLIDEAVRQIADVRGARDLGRLDRKSVV